MVEEEEFDWKKYLCECLDSTTVATLATFDENGVWATPLYFSYDEKLNFYFISSSNTRHMKDIKEDPRVALSVFTPQPISGIYQIGVQVEGTASSVPDKDIEAIYAIRAKRMNGDLNWVPEPQEGHFVKAHGGVFMKVIPTAITYIDTRFFGGNSRSVPLDKFTDKNSKSK